MQEAAQQGHRYSDTISATLSTIQATIGPNVVADTIAKFQSQLHDGMNPAAIGYRRISDSDLATLEFKEAAEAGDGASQYLYARQLLGKTGSEKLSLSWLKRAAEQNFADALDAWSYCLRSPNGKRDEAEFIRMQFKAASLGSSRAARDISAKMEDGGHALIIKLVVTNAELSQFYARSYVMWREGSMVPFAKVMMDAYQNFEADGDASALEGLFVIGREFKDYDQCYSRVDDETHALAQPAVKLYLKISARVRQAAVQSILILRDNRLINRDVATMIPKMVYASRFEVVAWYRDGD